MTISFTGLSSGFDSKSVIDSLVTAERFPVRALEKRKLDTNKRISVLSDLVTKLQSLQSKALGLDLPSEVRAVTATSSDETKVKVTATSQASPAVYSVSITKLAQAQTSKSNQYNNNNAGIAGTGTVKITVGSDPEITVNYTAVDTLTDIVARINASGVDATATLAYTGSEYQILFSGAKSGAAEAITFVETGNKLGFTNVGSTLVTAQDAQATIGGLTITRPTNLINDYIPNVTFDLRATTASAVQVTVANDPAGLAKKVQEMVDAYNDVAKVLAGQLSFGVTAGTKKGGDTLFGDPSLTSLQIRLGSVIGASYADGLGATSFGILGLKLATDGTITFDQSKFTTAVTNDPSVASRLLVGSGGNGLAAALDGVVKDYTTTSTGVLSAKKTGYTTQVAAFDKEIARIENIAAKVGERLQRQFTALDRTMATLNSQKNYLASIFG